MRLKKKKTRKSHFKNLTNGFCFENLAKICSVTKKAFYLERKYAGKFALGKIPAARCYCSECKTFLFGEKGRVVKDKTLIFSPRLY